jgi:hypothetical protein
MSDWSIRRIHQLRDLTDARSYLEVGVQAGGTFLSVDIAAKDAVDPAFPFDVARYQTPAIRFHQMCSDQFFGSRLPHSTYDIVFLDGLHTFQQTLRDFLATLTLSHERTVWLLDDTLPCDAFSALPDQAHSYRERERAGLPGNPWHGDVYKVVLALHDFFPNLNYATITDGGNPQTLIWREPRPDFAPLFSGLEAIERCSYFQLESCEPAFRFQTEGDALQLLSQSLGTALTPEAGIFG